MCGIWAVFGTEVGVSKHHDTLAKITHRGPDAWRTECDNRLKVLFTLPIFCRILKVIAIFKLVSFAERVPLLSQTVDQ
jgi:hypothetical protein